MANIGVTRMNKGLATPEIDARSDIEAYAGLCRVLENFIPRIYGSVVRRPGTRFVKEAK